MSEYFEMGHAEKVPESSVNHPPQHTFYLPMQTVQKTSAPLPSSEQSSMPLPDCPLECF